MRKNLLLLMMICFAGHSTYAKIWRVNNTGVPADFTTAQTANDAAGVANGDTIHFEPSGTDYGSLTLSKRLVIIGNGYFLGSIANNSNVDLQANTATSTIVNLYIVTGGSNSVIMGMTFNQVYIGYGSPVNNLLFRRNRVNGSGLSFYTGGSTNVQVMQCYIDGAVGQTASHTNILMANNIIIQGVTFDGDDNGTFQNNILHATGVAYASAFSNFTLRSNILLAGTISLNTCITENNLGSSTQFGTATGNQSNVDMSTVFTGYPTIGVNSYDGRYQLQNPGPGIATGYAGVDCGAYGNTTAYVKSGMPDVPSIYKLLVPPIVTNNSLGVTVSTRINQ